MFGHHAYLITGSPDGVIPELIRALEREGVSVHGNPDYIEIITPSLSIDDVRELSERTRTKVSPESRRIVVVSYTQAAHEAQNALLKITEEPGERTHLFFIVPHKDAVLPTLRSRLQDLSLETEQTVPKEVSVFLHGSFEDRMAILSPIIEEKQHDQALSLCNGLTKTLSQDVQKNRDALEALETARKYLLRRGSSLKLLLEFVALSVPRV